MPTDLVGQVLDDRYRVIAPLGEGAMGTVYRGERLKLGRMVAIKFLSGEFSESQRLRFEREAEAMAKLEHPNCSSVLDVGVHEDRPYVVMELVTGQNLSELLQAGPLPIQRAVEITRQVLSGLQHAHERGIIHRDIKPANIMLSQKAGVGDLVKILDFGLARFRAQSSNLTGAMVIGTPHYMAPEQVRGGDDLDHRVDIYQCGVLLFELLTGTKPFNAHDPVAVCMQQVTVDPPRLAERDSRVFGGLEDVVARALEKDRDKRYQGAQEFATALVEAATRLDAAPKPSEPAATITLPPSRAPSPLPVATSPTRNARRHVAIAAGVLVAAGIAVAIAVANRSDAKPAQVPVEAPVADAAVVVLPPPVGDSVAAILERAKGMSSERAIDVLLDARKTYPDDARLAYEASKLYLDKMWKADGLKLARIAIELEPAYKSDPELIKLVIKLFNTTASRDSTLARFLHDDIGDAAKPYLEETANGHPNPIVRKRAKAELLRFR